MSEKLGIKFANAEPLTGSAVAFEVCVKAGKFIYDEMDEKRLKETKEWIENNTNLLEGTKKAEPETRYIPGTETVLKLRKWIPKINKGATQNIGERK